MSIAVAWRREFASRGRKPILTLHSWFQARACIGKAAITTGSNSSWSFRFLLNTIRRRPSPVNPQIASDRLGRGWVASAACLSPRSVHAPSTLSRSWNRGHRSMCLVSAKYSCHVRATRILTLERDIRRQIPPALRLVHHLRQAIKPVRTFRRFAATGRQRA